MVGAITMLLGPSAQPASGQITVDNVSIAADGPASGTDGILGDAGPVATFSHTIGGGSDRLLVVGTSAEGTGDPDYDIVVTGVTYNGVAMIDINSVEAENGPGMLGTMHYLLDGSLPAAGTYDVVVTYSEGTISAAFGAISLNGAIQQGPEAMASSASPDQSGTTTANITTLTEDSYLVNFSGSGNSVNSFANSSGMSVELSVEIGTQELAIATKTVAAPGAQAITWTYDNPFRMAQVVAAFAAIPPVFSVTPTGGNKPIGGSHTFEVALASPDGAVSYQWKKNGTDIPGANAATLVLDELEESDAGAYVAVVTDSSGTYTTNAAILTVGLTFPAAGLWGLLLVAALLLGTGIYLGRRHGLRSF